MLRTCGSRPILTTNLTTNEVPLVSTAFGKTLEIRALAGTLVPAFYGSRRVRIPPTAPEKPERCHAVHTAWHQASFPAGSYDTPTAPELSGPFFSIGFHHAGHTPEEGVHFYGRCQHKGHDPRRTLAAYRRIRHPHFPESAVPAALQHRRLPDRQQLSGRQRASRRQCLRPADLPADQLFRRRRQRRGCGHLPLLRRRRL